MKNLLSRAPWACGASRRRRRPSSAAALISGFLQSGWRWRARPAEGGRGRGRSVFVLRLFSASPLPLSIVIIHNGQASFPNLCFFNCKNKMHMAKLETLKYMQTVPRSPSFWDLCLLPGLCQQVTPHQLADFFLCVRKHMFQRVFDTQYRLCVNVYVGTQEPWK